MTTACLPNRKMASLSTGKVHYRPSLPSAEYGRRSSIGHSELQSKVEEMFIMMHLNSLNYTTFVWVCIETNVIDYFFTSHLFYIPTCYIPLQHVIELCLISPLVCFDLLYFCSLSVLSSLSSSLFPLTPEPVTAADGCLSLTLFKRKFYLPVISKVLVHNRSLDRWDFL